MARGSLFCVLIAMTAAGCQTSSITGSTTGSQGPAQCPASSAREPDGTCICNLDYADCLDDAGEPFCTNAQLDNDNCGACGVVCLIGESCLGGIWGSAT